MPAAAKAWIETMRLPANGSFIGVNEKNLQKYRARLITALDLPAWPQNVLRKSWASHHLAAFENADLTAAQAGHTSAQTTHAKYRKARRKSDGEAWFANSPPL